MYYRLYTAEILCKLIRVKFFCLIKNNKKNNNFFYYLLSIKIRFFYKILVLNKRHQEKAKFKKVEAREY